MTSRIERTLNYAVLVSFALVVVIPLCLLVLAAVSPYQSGQPAPADMRWENFTNAWEQSDFASHLAISTVVSLTVVVATLVLTPLAAYGLGVLAAPGHRWVFLVFLSGIMIPLEGIIVPLYFGMRATPFASTLVALIIAHTGLSMSFGVFWMRASFRAIPPALLESARIDGADDFRTLRSIVRPLAVPALIRIASPAP